MAQQTNTPSGEKLALSNNPEVAETMERTAFPGLTGGHWEAGCHTASAVCGREKSHSGRSGRWRVDTRYQNPARQEG